jgi:transposase-like protein
MGYRMITIEPGLSPTGQRSFPIGYRVEFLREWDRCRERGAKARLLRENDLTQATVRRWIRSRDRGELEVSMAKASKRDKTSASVERAELARLRAENERLRRQVVQAEAAQDILGKAFELLQGINESSLNQEDPQIPPGLMSATEYAAWLQRHKLS